MNKIKTFAAAGLVALTTALSAQTQDTTKSYTLCIPGAVKTEIKTDLDTTVYTQGPNHTIVVSEEGTYKSETTVDKNKLTVKELDEAGLDKAYTGTLENKLSEKDSAIADIQAELDSTNNYVMKGSVAAAVGANFQDLGDNSFKVNPVVGLGYDFHLFQISPDSKLSLGIMGYLGTPATQEVTKGAPTVVKTETNNAGPYVYNSAFVDQTTTVESVKQVADVTLKGTFKIEDYAFSAGFGPSISTKAVSTTVDSEKQNSITALSTGNVIPSNTYDLGSQTTNDKTSVVVQGVNAEINYFGKDGKFGVGAYGSNLGSENPHFGLKATFKLYN